MANFDKIALEEIRNSNHFFVHDEKCLYSSTDSKYGTFYVQCIALDCQCSGKIVGNVFARTNDAAHNHDKDHVTQATYEKAFEELREAVKTQQTPIRKLHRDALKKGLSREVCALLTWDKCRKTLQRIRYAKMPPCHSLHELETLLEDSDNFVYSRFGVVREDRFYQATVDGNLIFANRALIKELPVSFDMFVDATFGVTPFYTRNQQLLVILGEIRHKPRPIAYIVMNGKSTKDYQTVFQFLRDGVFSFDGTVRKPKQVSLDFEKAMRNGVKAVWGNIELIGCYFHYCQALGRNASSTIKKGIVHKKVMWFFKRLALLPIDKVDEGYREIVRYIREKKLYADFKEFLEYFRSTWLVSFPKKNWNVSTSMRRTNNNLEGYNNKIKTIIKSKPSPWEFLDGLIDLSFDAVTSFDSDRISNAKPPADRSKLTKPFQNALGKLKAGSISVFGFLEELAQDFSNKK
jgi:hypothetical protein